MFDLAAIDTETTGLDTYHGCRPFMVTACTGKRNYVWQGTVDPQTRNVSWDPAELADLRRFIDQGKAVVFHNANFDIRMLAAIGIAITPQSYVEGFSLPTTYFPLIHDTIVASHIVCSGNRKLGHPHGLKELCVKYLGYDNSDEEELMHSVVQMRSSLKSYPDVQIARIGHPHFPAASEAPWEQDMWLSIDLCKKYAVRDVERTLLLHKILQARIVELNLYNQYLFRMELLHTLYSMQTAGINIYINKVDRVVKELDLQILQLVTLIRTTAGIKHYIDPASRKDLDYILYGALKLPVINSTETGQRSTDEATLDMFEKEYDNLPTIRYLRNWRKATKIRTDISTYKAWASTPQDPLPQEIFMPGRLHSTMLLTGTKWTRNAGADPNPQNFNKKLKYLFGPPKGYYWLYCDVVNIELRIWAYEVKSAALIKEFEAGVSVHMIIARALYPEMLDKLGEDAFKETRTYTNCKSGTFARMYGGGVQKVNDTYGVPGACGIIDKKLPEIGAYFADLDFTMNNNAEKFDYPCIFTTQGYKLDVPSTAPHSMPSARIQGTAGLIVQDMMIQVVKHKTYKNIFWKQAADATETQEALNKYIHSLLQSSSCRLIQQVHDSLTIEIPCHEHSNLTNSTLISFMEKVGQKHMPTCPLDYSVIECHEDEEPYFRDYLFTPEKVNGYSIEMSIHNHKYLCTAVYDKDDIIECYGSTKEEAYSLTLEAISNEVPF